MSGFKAALLIWGFIIGWMIMNIIRDRRRNRRQRGRFALAVHEHRWENMGWHKFPHTLDYHCFTCKFTKTVPYGTDPDTGISVFTGWPTYPGQGQLWPDEPIEPKLDLTKTTEEKVVGDAIYREALNSMQLFIASGELLRTNPLIHAQLTGSEAWCGQTSFPFPLLFAGTYEQITCRSCITEIDHNI